MKEVTIREKVCVFLASRGMRNWALLLLVAGGMGLVAPVYGYGLRGTGERSQEVGLLFSAMGLLLLILHLVGQEWLQTIKDAEDLAQVAETKDVHEAIISPDEVIDVRLPWDDRDERQRFPDLE